jgi:nicotinamide-nucleotide adenylyltransferase
MDAALIASKVRERSGTFNAFVERSRPRPDLPYPEHVSTEPPAPRPLPDRVGRLAIIARWKPVHIGHAAVLEALAGRADHAIVGIGSSNRYNARNPFTAAETATMIRLALRGRDNVSIVEVPDLDDGPRWRLMVKEMLGPLDLFVTANAYVRSLLLEDYPILHPVHLVPPERRVRVDGSMVRAAMARGEGWRALVPPEIERFLDDQGLVRRFRVEFGAETLTLTRPD